ncbi:MAG: RNA polymerase factor sigma-54 [Rikenellaceae bacterium]|jgi:RNA polymerase sigma-54 factor|nr:RNA polymerase factor sigma-54 [Rikenellaceae bacterium]
MAGLNQYSLQKMMQKLSPQQLQMIRLLELPALQLEQRIKQEIEENPILDEDAEAEKEADAEATETLSIDDYIRNEDVPDYKYYVNNYSKDDQKRPVCLSEGLSFGEYLQEQLGYKHLTERQETIGQYLIGSLDEDGYLRRPFEFLTDDIAFSTGLEATEEEVEEALKIIQELDPQGVGARDLRECLLLQLPDKKELIPSEALAKEILTDHYENFTKKHYDRLMSRLGVAADELHDAVDVITRLSPRPGTLYAESRSSTLPYIIPDFLLEYQNGEFILSLNNSNLPQIKINNHYIDMIREMSAKGDRQSESDRETVRFVKRKIDSAKWFISAIKQRQNTLGITMNAMLNYQKAFFVDGDQTELRPMILKDIADATGLDMSTVSRVVNSKYIQTHFGTLSLKALFSEAMPTDSGEEVSSLEIKKILSDCIEKEDKHKPLTDETLMETLHSKGYRIARRTIAKYREVLGIPVARLRKEI